jgi:hypothetical protein
VHDSDAWIDVARLRRRGNECVPKKESEMTWLARAVAVPFVIGALCSAPVAAKQDNGYGIEAVSTHANLVSGGDVLLKITYKHDLMDQWLANIAADTGSGTQAEKVARDKPAELVDSCYDSSLAKITNAAQCAQMFPYYNDPRLAAGAPATDDVFKCALKPVDPADYNPPLTDAQLATVRSAFADGVCDFRKTPVGKVPLADTWLAYPVPGTFESTQ